MPTDNDINHALQGGSIDYLKGKALKTYFADLSSIDPYLYDREYGQGALAQVVAQLKIAISQSDEKPSTLETAYNLLSDYEGAIRMTSGTGSRGQIFIDAAHERLVEFLDAHPEVDITAPRKYRCADAGWW